MQSPNSRFIRRVDEVTHDVYINNMRVGVIKQNGRFFHPSHEFLGNCEKSTTLKGAALNLSQKIAGSLLGQVGMNLIDCESCGCMHRCDVDCPW